MVKELNLMRIALFFVLHLYGYAFFAQDGNVQGVIIDNNGIAISGATVVISEVNKGTVSDLEGRFTLVNVPVGTYSLLVTYLGYSDIVKKIGTANKQTTFVSVILTPASILLEGVEVVEKGTTGQVRALNTQKTNPNITNVVSTDQIGKFPDANIGDAVKRISGIAIQVNQGEARDIIIRGLSPELNSVTLNGSRIPSAEGDNRHIQLDLIPSDMIQTIEVSKTLTPDMEADALGGSVNLVTRTSPQGFRVSATLGSGINFISDKRIWNTAFLAGNRTENDKLGWMISASINDNDFGSDNIEAQWADTFDYNTGALDPDGEPVIAEEDVTPYPKILEIQPLWIQRVRRSFAANFDYKLNNDHVIFLKTLYNWRDDRENRFLFEQEILQADAIEIGDFTIIDKNVVQFPVLAGRQTRGGINSKRSKNARLEDQRMQNYSVGGNHLLGGAKIDWLTSFSKASEEIKEERTAEFKSSYGILTDISNPKFPNFIPENAGDADDLSGFEYDEIIEENKYTEEEDINFFANVAFPSNFFRKKNGQFKFGIRGRLKSKLRENDFKVFDLENNFPTLADAPNLDYSDPDYLVGTQYDAGNFADERWLGSLNLRNGDTVPDEFLKQNFTVSENVFAGYLMINQKLSKKLGILTGVRLEHTLFKALANDIEEGSSVVGRINARESYNNFLPGIHFKYELSPETILRFAWTNTLSRPNYVDMVPTRDVVFSDREIFVGNSKLSPATSSNYDFMGEHYFKSVGIVSLGIFNKNIKNFIYTFRSEALDDSFGEGTTGFALFQPLNGEEASLFGVEISLQRHLDFLPGFAGNLTLDINYTYLNSTTEGVRDINGVDREDLNLPDTPPHLFNASLGYESKNFTARLSANFSDAYLNEVGGRSFEDIFYGRQFLLDLSAGYDINNNLSLYFGLNNITDQPLRLYQGIFERTAKAEFYERRLTFGIKYDVFKKKGQKEMP